MINKLTILGSTLLLLIVSCDSDGGDDECSYIGEWIGVTRSIYNSGADPFCDESSSVSNISCIEMNIYDTDLSFDTCSCNNEFYNEQECLDYEEFLEDRDCDTGTLYEGNNMVCTVEDDLLTCIQNSCADIRDCCTSIIDVYERN